MVLTDFGHELGSKSSGHDSRENNFFLDDEGSSMDDEGSSLDDKGSSLDDEGSSLDDEGSLEDEGSFSAEGMSVVLFECSISTLCLSRLLFLHHNKKRRTISSRHKKKRIATVGKSK